MQGHRLGPNDGEEPEAIITRHVSGWVVAFQVNHSVPLVTVWLEGSQMCAAACFDVFKEIGQGRLIVLGISAAGKIIETLLNFSPQGVLRPAVEVLGRLFGNGQPRLDGFPDHGADVLAGAEGVLFHAALLLIRQLDIHRCFSSSKGYHSRERGRKIRPFSALHAHNLAAMPRSSSPTASA